MNLRLVKFLIATMLLMVMVDRDTFAQGADEAAIRQAVQTMQEGWNKKEGTLFASPFAAEHDYVVINGMFLPKMTREENARQHQHLFDGVYKQVNLQLRVSKIRFLSRDIAVAHIQGHSYMKGNAEQVRQHAIITMVFQKNGGKWEITAFQNTPVEQREVKQEKR